MQARVISENLNVRSAPAVGDNIVGSLRKDESVVLRESNVSRWAAIDYNGATAYVSRRLLAQDSGSLTIVADAAQAIIAEVIDQATSKYDGITYRLGCKAKATGDDSLKFSGSDIAGAACSGRTVDCSGWVAGLFQLVARNVNARVGATFDAADLNTLLTHSDGQITGTASKTKQIWSGTDIDDLELRSGLLFGLNNGDYDWEGQDRAFGIDHIVMGLKTPAGYVVTQSSSSGGGVNRIAWTTWRNANATRFADFRVQCVDLLALGSWATRARGEPANIDLRDKPFKAAPG